MRQSANPSPAAVMRALAAHRAGGPLPCLWISTRCSGPAAGQSSRSPSILTFDAGQIREELLSVINRGAEALIADLTATISCDHAGADALSRGYQRAIISGTELRLVVAAQFVRRILSLNGLDRLVPIYPSLQAATAARAPATVIPVAATRPERPVAGITPAVTGKLVDALQDGVALTDGGGTLVLANLRLEEMFGYPHAELTRPPGRNPDTRRASGRSPRPPGRLRPGTQGPAMGAGARLVALRKDGTTFPGRDQPQPGGDRDRHPHPHRHPRRHRGPQARRPRRPGPGPRCAARQAHDGQELLDSITTSLYDVGLSLQAAADLPHDAASKGIAEAAPAPGRHDPRDPRQRIHHPRPELDQVPADGMQAEMHDLTIHVLGKNAVVTPT